MEIITENYNYESGDCVSGFLKLITNDNFRPSHVQLSLIGVAQVKLVELSPLPFKETLKTTELLRIDSELDDEQLKPEEDVQEIRFAFNLPVDIPSSFQGSDGSIVYKVLAKITTRDDQEHMHSHEIKVHTPFKNRLKTSIGSSVEKDFGFLSLGSGRIILNATLPRKGYIAGETIELQCDVYNESTVDCTPRATLYQTQVFMCGERHKASQLALAEPVVGEKVEKNTNNSQKLTISLPLNASLSIKSDIISIKYFIHVTLDIPHAFDIHVNLPIVVTTRSALSTPE